uniref:Uncharacterized protein n=1 Tax=Lotus japonicus TaxID=34305 RepID=I3SUB6_LOTJA|nr:unknown [Lotus japonicus]
MKIWEVSGTRWCSLKDMTS